MIGQVPRTREPHPRHQRQEWESDPRCLFCRQVTCHLSILPFSYSINSKSSLHLRLPILGDRSIPSPQAPLGTLGLPGLFLEQ
jgi:hypothetical protein